MTNSSAPVTIEFESEEKAEAFRQAAKDYVNIRWDRWDDEATALVWLADRESPI